MKLKLLVAGAFLAASFGASAATINLGTLDGSGPDTQPGQSSKFGENVAIDDFWTFKLTTPSSTSFGAQQNFSTLAGEIANFKGVLLGYGALSYSLVGKQQNLSWSGNLEAGTYTVEITGLSKQRNSQYTGSVSAQPVPEPETYGMLLGGLALVGVAARRKAKKAA